MVKFLSRLAAVSAILLMIIIGMHAVAIWNMQDEVNAVYKIDAATEVLFLGSSQVGCSIDEDEEQLYHLRKLWVSETITPSCLMRLKELERRGQLENLKTVVVPFNIYSVTSLGKNGYLWAWYLELPVSWRYMDMLPYGKLDLAWYMLCNQRFPFRMLLEEVPPEREALAERPEAYRNKMLSQFRKEAREMRACGSAPEWEGRLFDAYREMDEICRRHGIRFVVYKVPLLPAFERNFPAETQAQIAAYEQRLCDMHIEYVKPQIGLDERHFFDSVHLTMPGAKIFTEELFRQLNGTR
jgi:hypothetical protein